MDSICLRCLIVFNKITAYAAAGLIIIGSCLAPLLVAFLLVTLIPGARFTASLDSVLDWIFFLSLFSVVSWLIDMIEKWAKVQSVIFLKSKTAAKTVSLTVELGLMTYLFSRFIEPFGSAFIIAIIVVFIGLAIEAAITKNNDVAS